MADNTGDRARRNIQEINEIVSAIDSGFRSISSRLEDVADIISNTNNEARVFNNIINDVGRSVNRLSKQNENLIDNEIKLNQGLLTSKKIRQQINDIEATRNVLESRLNTLKNQELEGLILNEEQLAEIIKLEQELGQQSQDVTSQYQNQLQIIQKIETKLGIFGRLTKGLNKIPLIGDLLNADAALQAMNKSALAGKSIFKNLGAGISAAFKGIEKSTIILAAFSALYKVIKFFGEAMLGADKRVTDIAKNLSISKDSARAVYQSFIDSKTVLNAQLSTTKNIVEAFNELSDFSNFINLATTKQLDTQIILTKEIGVSKEAALGFQSTLAVSNIEADKGLDIVYNQIAAFSRQNGIVANGRKIFEEINKTSKLIQLNFRGGFESLVKTTLQANKLGLSLDQVSKVGSSLLDFESSISAELEAELLTGRNINLEKARLFALNHDIAGLTQEIANQNITAESFAAMNVIQQEAIAKALGMQASELGEALYNQKLIEQTAGNFTKDLRAQAAEARKLNNLALEKKLLLQAEGIEKGIISGKDLEAAQRSLDIQDKFNNALEQAQEIFSDLVNGGILDDLVNLLTAFVKSVQTKGLGSTLLGGIDEAAQREADLMQAKRNTQNISVSAISKKSESEQNADIEALQEKKRVLQEQIDKKPGFFTEANYAINKFTGFDPLKVSAAVPERERQATEAQKQLPEVEKLLRELTEAVKQGGNINMEARQVGTTTAINTYRM
jgi:hypothetical protein